MVRRVLWGIVWLLAGLVIFSKGGSSNARFVFELFGMGLCGVVFGLLVERFSKRTLIGAGFFVAVIWGLVVWEIVISKPQVEKARLSEIRTRTQSLIESMEGHSLEYGTYTEDLKAIAFSPEGKIDANFYLGAKSLPDELAKKLAPEDVPFVTKDDYRILIAYRRKDDAIILFKIEKKMSELVRLRKYESK